MPIKIKHLYQVNYSISLYLEKVNHMHQMNSFIS